MKTLEECINALKHIADDHECCKQSCLNIVDYLLNMYATYEAKERIVYDTMIAIQSNSTELKRLVERDGSRDAVRAYKDGVYSPCVKLQVVLGEEGMLRGKARYEKIRADLEAFVKSRKLETKGSELSADSA